MTEKTQQKIRIKWVRSGIGFSYRAKEMIRSLGLRRLNQVVERPETPQVRGLVAKIPHLVEIVNELPQSAWASVPEYTIAAAEKLEPAPAEVALGQEATPAPAEGEKGVDRPAPEPKREKATEERAKASRTPAARKRAKVAGAEKGKTAVAIESRKKEKAAPGRRSKPSGKSKR